LDLITHCTNNFICSIQQNISRQRDVRDTTAEELQTLIGLLLLWVTKSKNISRNEIWEKAVLGVDFIQSGMSQERFLSLLCALRFDVHFFFKKV
jgi:hypothetical protein